MTVKIIAAVSKNGVIGQDGNIPWNYPEDFGFFRKMTTGGVVIFGRKTFESIGRPLPKRTNIVITRQEKIKGPETWKERVYCHPTLASYLDAIVAEDQATTKWLCGGSEIYREGMKYASEIYLTLIPEEVSGNGLVLFPWIDPTRFEVSEVLSLEDSELKAVKYIRRN